MVLLAAVESVSLALAFSSTRMVSETWALAFSPLPLLLVVVMTAVVMIVVAAVVTLPHCWHYYQHATCF